MDDGLAVHVMMDVWFNGNSRSQIRYFSRSFGCCKLNLSPHLFQPNSLSKPVGMQFDPKPLSISSQTNVQIQCFTSIKTKLLYHFNKNQPFRSSICISLSKRYQEIWICLHSTWISFEIRYGTMPLASQFQQILSWMHPHSLQQVQFSFNRLFTTATTTSMHNKFVNSKTTAFTILQHAHLRSVRRICPLRMPEKVQM